MNYTNEFFEFFKLSQSINDKDLWEKFNKYLQIHSTFLGKSYQSLDESHFRKKNSAYYISEINKELKLEEEKPGFNPTSFQFNHPVYDKFILKLWRELFKDAVVYLKEKDSKEKYHDTETFGIDQLYKYFERFVEFEEVLYENVQFYRDHIFHVFRVFLLGMVVLIDKKIISRLQIYEKDFLVDLKKIEKKLPNSTKEDFTITCEEKIAMWIIIALTHDLGYPLEKLSSINRKVRDMLEAFGRSNIQEIEITFPPQGEFINDFVLKFISTRLVSMLNSDEENIKEEDVRFDLHLQSKYWIKFSRAFEEYNHSIISCILLMKYLVYFLESDYLLDKTQYLKIRDQKQFQIRREILRSIAVHNCDYIYHLNSENFGFLLTIVDDLQCWGRPSGRLTRHALSWDVKLIEYNETKVDFAIITSSDIDDKELHSIFISLAKKYTKILRGGVGGKHRKFNFSFRILRNTTELKKQKPKESLLLGLEYEHNLPLDEKKNSYYEVKVNKYYREKVIEENGEPIIMKVENIPINEYLAQHRERFSH